MAGTIMNQVWDYIRHADAVIADVTGRNPNVLYEAGMAHALGKPVVLLLQETETAPFDIAAERRIPYRLENLPRLEQELGKAIAALPRLPHRDLADLDH
jgi:nucleoside 2-deoxyribosyltransferase